MPEIYGTRSRKMEVTYDYYRIFYYAAKYKSFSQAATILMSNQPNVTRAIHNLESQLGCRLFIRSNRGAELTPEGERLYSHVAIAYDHLHAAELELENEKKLEQGTVTIGVSEIALHLLLLPVLGEFRRKYPKIRLRISSYTAPQAVQTVRNGLSDFAVASTPAEVKKPLKAIPLLSFKEILVANAAYKDMFKEPVSLKKLVEYPFICLGKNTSTYDFYTRAWNCNDGRYRSSNHRSDSADGKTESGNRVYSGTACTGSDRAGHCHSGSTIGRTTGKRNLFCGR